MCKMKWSKNEVRWDDTKSDLIATTHGPTQECREYRAKILAEAMNDWLENVYKPEYQVENELLGER